MPRMLKNYWSLRRKKITEVCNLLFCTTRLVLCAIRLGASSGKQPLIQGCFSGVPDWKMIEKCCPVSPVVSVKRQLSKHREGALLEGLPHSLAFNVDYCVFNDVSLQWTHSFLRKKKIDLILWHSIQCMLTRSYGI